MCFCLSVAFLFTRPVLVTLQISRLHQGCIPFFQRNCPGMFARRVKREAALHHQASHEERISRSESMNTAIIHTEQLSRSFGNVQAVNELSLDVPAGILFAFLGPNGAGKTTTIQLLLGLLEPSHGRASVLGFDTRMQADRIRERTGTLLEFSGLYERMSAAENLDFYGRIYQISAPQRRARIKELLTHLDLWDRRDERVGTWSRGMKQQLAVARALLHRPQLVFLDEPVAGLDPVAASRLNNDLASLVKHEGVTVFLNTHNMADAQKLADQVGVIRQGKLLALGNPDELRLRQGGPQADIYGHGFTTQMVGALREQAGVVHVEQNKNHLTIRLRDRSDMGPLVTLIVHQGGVVEEVRRGDADLEDVFLALMEEQRA
jgi:ABC-2 type transport system ATP-binding protein